MNPVRSLALEPLENRIAPVAAAAWFGLATADSHTDTQSGTTTLASGVTDEDGYYAIVYQHIGAPANYSV